MRLVLFLIFCFLISFASSFKDFKEKFIINNSYVIDPYNNNRVTSESQGYGLLIALEYNDKKLFDNLWNWTKNHMQRDDFLFSWIWNGKILDINNATDGDLLIAYALLKAYYKWHNSYYLNESKNIMNSIKELIIPVKENYLLIPGKYGFIHNNIVTLFPSYYITFILKEFYKFDKDINWIGLYKFAYNKIFTIPNLTTKIKFDLFKKTLYKGDYSDLDVYRIIPYVYVERKDISFLMPVFLKINNFFIKHGYIPLKFGKKVSGYSPYCVYEWFYLLYSNPTYLNKAKLLKKEDKNNYYCEAISLLLKEKK